MAKFKKGDRVVNLQDNGYVQKHAIGTVDEDDPTPYVVWDKPQHNQDNHWPRDEGHLQLLSEWEAEQKGEEVDWSIFRDSDMHLTPFQKIEKLEAENARLRAELEELKPKSKTWEGWVYLFETSGGGLAVHGWRLHSGCEPKSPYIARKRFTITEGEGME